MSRRSFSGTTPQLLCQRDLRGARRRSGDDTGRQPYGLELECLRICCSASDARPRRQLWVVCHEAQPVHTVARNSTRDEGGPFGFGDQEPIPSHCKLLRSRAVVVSVAVKVRTAVRAGMVERGERKRTAAEASKAVR
jgi:hypothetical protein